jgi:hypothetical protein
MNTALIFAAIYFAIPFVSIKISGRMITWQGWLVMLFLWPVAWLFMGPEELP